MRMHQNGRQRVFQRRSSQGCIDRHKFKACSSMQSVTFDFRILIKLEATTGCSALRVTISSVLFALPVNGFGNRTYLAKRNRPYK